MDSFDAISCLWVARGKEAERAENFVDSIDPLIPEALLSTWMHSRNRYVDALANALGILSMTSVEQKNFVSCFAIQKIGHKLFTSLQGLFSCVDEIEDESRESTLQFLRETVQRLREVLNTNQKQP